MTRRTTDSPARRARGAGCRLSWALAWYLAVAASVASAQAPLVTELRVEQDGRPVTDPEILALITTSVGRPFSMIDVKESEEHLLRVLNRFDDVVVSREPAPGGIRLVYRLVPRRPIDRMEFQGTLGVGEDALRREPRDR